MGQHCKQTLPYWSEPQPLGRLFRLLIRGNVNSGLSLGLFPAVDDRHMYCNEQYYQEKTVILSNLTDFYV